ncbi:hypothetical protein ACFX13_008026 [Malus domestica]
MEFPAAYRLGIEESSSGSIMTFSCRRWREDAVELSVKDFDRCIGIRTLCLLFSGFEFVISVFFSEKFRFSFSNFVIDCGEKID